MWFKYRWKFVLYSFKLICSNPSLMIRKLLVHNFSSTTGNWTFWIRFNTLSSLSNWIRLCFFIDTVFAILIISVFCYVSFRYCTVTSDVLTSVKKMEDSLKRLKKVRGTEKSSGSQGMSDDDKIRQQLVLDISNYGTQVSIVASKC